jgi:hypothetical protein
MPVIPSGSNTFISPRARRPVMVARTRSALTEEMTVGTGPGVDASAQAGGLAGLAGPEHGDGTPTPRRRLQAAAAVDR